MEPFKRALLGLGQSLADRQAAGDWDAALRSIREVLRKFAGGLDLTYCESVAEVVHSELSVGDPEIDEPDSTERIPLLIVRSWLLEARERCPPRSRERSHDDVCLLIREGVLCSAPDTVGVVADISELHLPARWQRQGLGRTLLRAWEPCLHRLGAREWHAAAAEEGGQAAFPAWGFSRYDDGSGLPQYWRPL